MPGEQFRFTDVESGTRRRVPRRGLFLETMHATIPWSRRVGLIEPVTRSGRRGRKPKALETMRRMHLLQAWISLSDEGVEGAVYDSDAMRLRARGPSEPELGLECGILEASFHRPEEACRIGAVDEPVVV